MKITGERYNYKANIELKVFQRFLIDQAINGSDRGSRYTPYRKVWQIDNTTVEFDIPISYIRNYVNGHMSLRDLIRRCEFTFWSDEHEDWELITFQFSGESLL